MRCRITKRLCSFVLKCLGMAWRSVSFRGELDRTFSETRSPHRRWIVEDSHLDSEAGDPRLLHLVDTILSPWRRIAAVWRARGVRCRAAQATIGSRVNRSTSAPSKMGLSSPHGFSREVRKVRLSSGPPLGGEDLLRPLRC